MSEEDSKDENKKTQEEEVKEHKNDKGVDEKS